MRSSADLTFPNTIALHGPMSNSEMTNPKYLVRPASAKAISSADISHAIPGKAEISHDTFARRFMKKSATVTGEVEVETGAGTEAREEYLTECNGIRGSHSLRSRRRNQSSNLRKLLGNSSGSGFGRFTLGVSTGTLLGDGAAMGGGSGIASSSLYVECSNPALITKVNVRSPRCDSAGTLLDNHEDRWIFVHHPEFLATLRSLVDDFTPAVNERMAATTRDDL